MEMHPTDLPAYRETTQAEIIHLRHEDEDISLSQAVIGALEALREIATDNLNSNEERMEAASHILDYSTTFQPNFNIDVGKDDDEDE